MSRPGTSGSCCRAATIAERRGWSNEARTIAGHVGAGCAILYPPMASAPQRQLRWGRVIGALIVVAGLIAGAILLVVR
jgi:hypothetical protein